MTHEAVTALVVHPGKVPDLDDLCARITARCTELGLPPLLVLETSVEDPGLGQARSAVAQGATLVMAAGGDGTVRAVAQAMTGTGVPMAVLPQGTGNLLARNLDIPVDPVQALDAALGGTTRRIDVGRLVEGTDALDGPGSDGAASDGPGEGMVFTIMAGAGFDAAMMREAPEGLKDAVGWPAYLIGGIRGLRRRKVRVELTLDGGEIRRATVRTVLIGNVGQLQGGLELLPDALPDDGLLDVALVAPKRFHDWVILVVRGLTRRHRRDARLKTYQAREVRVRMDGRHPRQVDGDLIADGVHLVARIEPGALLMKVPTPDGAPATDDGAQSAGDAVPVAPVPHGAP